ncbi:MAG: peptidoglycan DD-metalloendopeptidase family protein [Bacteroidetes bacterium]|nr:peptidoglycan DD-metalloendopeptidase family protein [Bacteroidota bacterium]
MIVSTEGIHKFVVHCAIVMIFLLGTVSFNVTLAQQSHPDSLSMNEDDLYVPEDTLALEQEYLPPDVIFIPSDVLYNHSWDNTNVRQRREDLSTMDDTIDIYLAHPSESPFVFPRPGRFLSPYGYRGRHFHAGVDIKLNNGDSVVSAFDGKVRLAKKYRGYGNVIVIRHFNGLETVYGHLSKILVAMNQDVKAGELIGYGGHTGRATTAHLHFETRFLGEPFNPGAFIDLESFKVKNDTLHITSSLFDRGTTRGKKNKSKSMRKATGSAEADGDTQIYKVRKGDTLSKIATEFNTTVKQLKSLNHLSKRSKLKVGQRLKVN